jgi:hypothetical protein
MDYRLLIDLEVVEILDRMPKTGRRRRLEEFHRIRSFPGNFSDYQEYDAAGRRVEIRIVSGWAVHYWDDIADRHVKILEALAPQNDTGDSEYRVLVVRWCGRINHALPAQSGMP